MSLNRFISYLSLEKKYSDHTVTAYQRDIEAFGLFCSGEFGFNGIDDVEYPLIRNWIVCLVDLKITNRSINRKVASLKAYYKFLQGVGIIDTNPLAKHRALKTSKKIEIPFSEEEMHKVLSHIEYSDDFEGNRDKLIIELLYTTGIRRAELIHLKVADVDLAEGLIKVLGKRNKERVVPLLPTTVQAFRTYF